MQTSLLLEKIPLGIIIFNENNQIVAANSLGTEFINNTRDCLIETIRNLVAKTFDNLVSYEKVIKYCNVNDFFVWSIKTELIKYSSPRVMLIIQDATMTLQLEQTVLKAEKLAVAGHLAIGSLVEIRNPLTIASGFCQLIKKNSKMEKEYIETISNELDKIQDIIEGCTKIAETSPANNLELIYRKIWVSVRRQMDSCKLIMVTGAFDNATINIAEDHVNAIITKLIKLLDFWVEENAYILINVELDEEARYLNLNIRAHCDLRRDISGADNLEYIIEYLEGKNSQIELQITNDNSITVNLSLPIIIPQISESQEKSEIGLISINR